MKRVSAVIWMLAGSLFAECSLNPQPFPPNSATADAGSTGPASQLDASVPSGSRGADASAGSDSASDVVDGAVLDAASAPSEDASADAAAADTSAEAETDAAEMGDAPIDGEGPDADAGAVDAPPEAEADVAEEGEGPGIEGGTD